MIHIEYDKSKFSINKNETIFSTGDYKYLIAEIILTAASPNIFYHGIDITVKESFNNYELVFPLNYLLFPFVFLRLYKPLRLILYLTKYFDFRADRISLMMGQKLEFIFAIKCLTYKNPTTSILIALSISILTFSLLMNMYEGPVFRQVVIDNPTSTNSFESYFNCLWFVIITTTTIGFGDYYPITNIGRLVTIMAAIAGSVCLSILTYTTLCYFTVTETEQHLITFISRIESKRALDKTSAVYLKASIKYLLARNCLVKFLKQNPVDLKLLSDQESKGINNSQTNNVDFNKIRDRYYAALYSKIKAKRDFKHIYQYVQDLFI